MPGPGELLGLDQQLGKRAPMPKQSSRTFKARERDARIARLNSARGIGLRLFTSGPYMAEFYAASSVGEYIIFYRNILEFFLPQNGPDKVQERHVFCGMVLAETLVGRLVYLEHFAEDKDQAHEEWYEKSGCK